MEKRGGGNGEVVLREDGGPLFFFFFENWLRTYTYVYWVRVGRSGDVHMGQIWNGFRCIHSRRKGFGVKVFSVFILRP